MSHRLLRRSLGTLAATSLLAVTAAGLATDRPLTAQAPHTAATLASSTTPADGYVLVGADGSSYPFATQTFGSVYNLGLTGLYGSRPLAAPVVGAAAVPGGGGYWLVGADGGVFSFGDAGFYGNTYTLGLTGLGGSRPLAAPIVGMAATPDGKGYWLVAADGGVFSFGDAGFYGNTYTLGLTGLGGSRPLAAPIVGIVPTPDGKGYWLVAKDGGVFSFGDAGFYGNTYTLGLTGLGGSRPLAAPVVGMATTPDGKGYWLVAADGGVFSFGDAGFYGNTYTLGLTGLGGSRPLAAPVVGIDPSPTGAGYTLVAADGGVFTFGDASFDGTTYSMGYTGLAGSHPLPGAIVGAIELPAMSGVDLSNFNCSNLPYLPVGDPLLLVESNGWPFSYDWTSNSGCAPDAFQQAVGLGGSSTQLYVFAGASNTIPQGTNMAPLAIPPAGTASWSTWNGTSFNPVPQAALSTPAGQLYTSATSASGPGAYFSYGYDEAEYAYATSFVDLGSTSSTLRNAWWLDVELSGSWTSSTTANRDAVYGALAFLESVGVSAGVYSTNYQWGDITGGATLPAGTPLWVPDPGADPASVCAGTAGTEYAPFGGGTIRYVQYGATTAFSANGNGTAVDLDTACP